MGSCDCSSTDQRPRPAGRVLNQIRNSPVRSQNAAERALLAQYITNNSGGGKTLTFGSLLTFPLEGRMFYVQPIYVQAAAGSGSFPQNKITVAVYGTTVAWGDALEQAVSGLFGQVTAARRRRRRPIPVRVHPPRRTPVSRPDRPQREPAALAHAGGVHGRAGGVEVR